MVYVDSYHLVMKPGRITPVMTYDNPPFCPFCGSHCLLEYRDSVRRHFRKNGGSSAWIEIPRGECPQCHVIHRILPGSLPPFKHYLTSVISGFLDMPSYDDPPDHPCEKTIERWSAWIDSNIDILTENGLSQLRKGLPDWLGEALKRIYNNGGKLET